MTEFPIHYLVSLYSKHLQIVAHLTFNNIKPGLLPYFILEISLSLSLYIYIYIKTLFMKIEIHKKIIYIYIYTHTNFFVNLNFHK